MSIILCTLSCFSIDIICPLSHKISRFKSCKRYEKKPQNCKHFGGGIIDFEQRRLFAFLPIFHCFIFQHHSFKQMPDLVDMEMDNSLQPLTLSCTVCCNHFTDNIISSFHHLVYFASFQRKYLIWLEWKWTILCSHLLRPPLSAVITSLIISFHLFII